MKTAVLGLLGYVGFVLILAITPQWITRSVFGILMAPLAAVIAYELLKPLIRRRRRT